MRKYITGIFILTTAVLFSGCQKNTDVVDPGMSLKSAKILPAVSLELPGKVCAGEEFAAGMSVDSRVAGKFVLEISDDRGKTWVSAGETGFSNKQKENFYVSLSSGVHEIRVVFIPQDSSAFHPVYSEIIERKVSECLDCESLLLEPNLKGENYLVSAGETVLFTAEYTVTACDGDYRDLKLSGALIANAVYKSSYPEASEVTNSNRNTGLRWALGDLKMGSSRTFSIEFEYTVPDAPYGTLVPLTGGWIIEGRRENGKTVRTGDYNEIFVQIK